MLLTQILGENFKTANWYLLIKYHYIGWTIYLTFNEEYIVR